MQAVVHPSHQKAWTHAIVWINFLRILSTASNFCRKHQPQEVTNLNHISFLWSTKCGWAPNQKQPRPPGWVREVWVTFTARKKTVWRPQVCTLQISLPVGDIIAVCWRPTLSALCWIIAAIYFQYRPLSDTFLGNWKSQAEIIEIFKRSFEQFKIPTHHLRNIGQAKQVCFSRRTKRAENWSFLSNFRLFALIEIRILVRLYYHCKCLRTILLRYKRMWAQLSIRRLLLKLCNPKICSNRPWEGIVSSLTVSPVQQVMNWLSLYKLLLCKIS